MLASIVFCSIKGIDENAIKRLSEESTKKMECIICWKSLLDGEKEANNTLYLTACPGSKQHIFHANCFAGLCVNTADGKISCPVCHTDWRGLLCQILTSHQDGKLTEPLRTKMLERMSEVSRPRLELFFDRINFTIDDYESMAKSLAGTQYMRVKDAATNRATIGLFEHKGLYECLVSKKINHMPTEEYERLLIRYICSGFELELKNIFKNLLQGEYLNDRKKRAFAKKFVEILVSAPHDIILSVDYAYELISALLEHKMTDSAKFVLENTDIVHTMSVRNKFIEG